MLNIAVYLVLTLLVVGVLLWAVDQLPWISVDIKKVIHVLVVVIAVLWCVGILFPQFRFPARP